MHAQMFTNNFESWTDTHHPVGFWGSKTSFSVDSVNQYSTSVHGGTYAVQLICMSTSHKRFTTVAMPVDSNVTYTVSFWVRGHGSVRTGIFDNRAGTSSGYFYNTYISVNSTTWTLESQTITALKTYSAGEFIFSVKSSFADLDHIQIDDVTITSSSPNAPTLTINSPVNNSVFYNTTAVSITYTVTNFTLGTSGSIKYTVNSGASQTTTSNPIDLTGLPVGANTVVLELVDMNGQSLNPAVTATVHFSISATLPNYVSIHDIQYTTDASGNSPYMNDTITTSGIVTGKYNSGFFIQNGVGPWTGLYVFSSTAASQVSMGDSVTLVGTITEYYNLTEMKNVAYVAVNSSSNNIPDASVLTAIDINTEPYEGVMVQIMHATCTNPSAANYMWKVDDGTDSCKVHDLLYNYTPVLNHIYNVKGPLYFTHTEYCIEPRMVSDIQDVTGIEENSMVTISMYPNPVKEKLNIVSPSTIQSLQVFDINGRVIYSKNEINRTNFSIPVNSLKNGNYFLQLNFDNNLIGVYRFNR